MPVKKKSPAKPKYHPMHLESSQWVVVDETMKAEIGKRRPKQAEIERARAIAERLFEEFPEAHCALNFRNPLQLLVATILSAQCTDERVNIVTKDLFKKYKTAADFAASPPGELEQDIRSTGFFNSKAKSIRGACQTLVDEFGGKVPQDMESLLRLRGTARKTASVVRMHAYGLPGISVDTHFSRITQRLRLTKATDPKKIEFDLGALLPPEIWTHFADAVILHGRKTCQSRKPKCEECRINDLCPSAGLVPATTKKKTASG